MMVIGSIIWSNAVEDNSTDPFNAIFAPYTTTKGTGLTAVGLLVAAGSIPFFIASRKNKRRAMSVSLKNEMTPQIQKNNYVCRPVPSLSLKISL